MLFIDFDRKIANAFRINQLTSIYLVGIARFLVLVLAGQSGSLVGLER